MVMRMKEEFISIGKAARYLGMSIEGLRKWEVDGVLIPQRTPTGHRRYHVSDLQKIMHDECPSPENNRCAFYARVSTIKQEEAGNLERQIGRLSTYSAQKNWVIVAIVSDVASGLNEKRGGKRWVDAVTTALQNPTKEGEQG